MTTPAIPPLTFDDGIIVGQKPPEFCEKYLNESSGGDIYVEIIRLLFCVLFALSVAGLIFIASTIMFNKKLQTHPQPMIAWICLAEACMSYNALIEVLNPVFFICYFSTYRILGYTIFRDVKDPDEMQSLANTQCLSNQIFYSGFQLLSLTLNLCLCIDLILAIYDPFSPAYRRTKKYYLFSAVASFMLVMIIWGLDSAHNNNDDENIQYDCLNTTKPEQFVQIQNQANLVLAMTLSLYIVVAIYSTVYSYRRLHRPGVSAPVRSLFVKKHFLYVVVFIVIWMIQQSNNYYYLFNPTQTTINTDTDG